MSLASLTPLHERDATLRDPTREELFNGPKRDQLPVEIQQMDHDDTACTFCGVSYFVFSEVQELQATAKKYKKTFHDFVRFMERERKLAAELKAQVATLKKNFDDAAKTFSAAVQRLTDERGELQRRDQVLTQQLGIAVQDADARARELHAAHTQHKRAEDEWTLATAMTEQRLRNEILHLSTQLEKCKPLTASQEAEFAAEMGTERVKIKELEVLLASTRESMSAAERQQITERDLLKQQLLAANERVEMEREAAKQLESQIKAVHLELQRVVSSSSSDKAAFATLHHEITTLKQQIGAMEKAKGVLMQERDELKSLLEKSSHDVHSFRLDLVAMEHKANENAATTARLKQEYAKELEALRLEHGQSINRMQRDHQKAIDDLKSQQKTYIEFLQKQTSETATATVQTMQHALLETEAKLKDTEKQMLHWRNHAQQVNEELQHLRLSHQQQVNHVQSMERQLTTTKNEVRDLVQETQSLQQQLEGARTSANNEMEKARSEAKAQVEQQINRETAQLQRQLETLQAKYDHVRKENEPLVRQRETQRKTRSPEDDDDDSTPRTRTHQAWGDGRSTEAPDRRAPSSKTRNQASNQEQLELEKLVESLRRSLEQKDKEISLLQQTVHRECLERTSLLEKMRSGKVLPDLMPSAVDASMRRSSSAPRRDAPSSATNHTENEESDDHDEGHHDDPAQPKAASFYERLRRAGQRKHKPRKAST